MWSQTPQVQWLKQYRSIVIFLPHISLEFIRWTRECLRPRRGRARLARRHCSAVCSPHSQGHLWSQMASPALAATFTLQSGRRKKSEDKGRLSSFKDASQKRHPPSPLTSHRLELCHEATPAQENGKYNLLFWGS